MNRRNFVAASAMALCAGLVPGGVLAESWVDFDNSDPISTALSEGKTVLVDFAASWCSTCAAQERVINDLRAQNPAYDENIVFVRVDWDRYGRKPVARDRRIPRRSTLIVLQGDKELGRLIAGTNSAQIQELLDTALSAADT